MSAENKKILVSGVKPTGNLHIGNYFGAMKQNIELGNKDEYESYIFIADYHALTTVKNKDTLNKNTFDIACAYLACGLDITKVTLFKQSDVPYHTELAKIFENVVTMPYMMRAHAFKDAEAKDKEINVGVFTYPILMAADILMYNADIVPVGADQKQHIEYARDIAGFYNRTWEVNQFKFPKEYTLESLSIVPGVDGEKMAKSKGNIIPLFGTEDEVFKAIMRIKTDSKGKEELKDEDDTIFKLAKLLCANSASILENYVKGGMGYGTVKQFILSGFNEMFSEYRIKYLHYQNNPEEVESILKNGAEKANIKASETMKKVRLDTGLDF